MSRHFELLRKAHGQVDLLPPVNPRAPAPYLGKYDDRPFVPPHYEASDWEWLFAVLMKQRMLIAAFAMTTFVVVAVVTLLLKPVYEPVTRVEVDPPGAEIFSLQGNNAVSGDSEYLQTEAQKIKSDELALEVIRALQLDRNADLVPEVVSTAASGPPSLHDEAPQGNEGRALKAFRERVRVTRDSGSRLISVSFTSHDPELAAAVTNKMLDLFIDDSYRTRHDAILKSTEWLSKQLDDIRKKMEDSNRALADFQKENGIADTGENRNTVAEEMADLNRQLTQAQADRIQLQAFLEREREASPDTLPQVRSNPVIQQMTQKLADVRAELAQSEVIYGKNHPNIKKLQNQAQELEAQINTQRGAIVSELKTTYAAARAREQMMGVQIKNTTQALNQMAQYNELKRDAQASTDLYNSLYAKIKEAAITAASKSSNMRVVDRARVLDSPTRPRRGLNLAMGLLGGLVGGMFLAFARERLDRRLHTVADVRKCVGLPRVLAVPAIAGRKQLLLSNGESGGAGARHLFNHPYSPAAEALRSLRAGVLSPGGAQAPQVVVVASASEEEGKTSLAVGLAASFAQHGKVCLIDTHLRNPGVARALGLRAEKGLAEVLAGSLAPEQALNAEPDTPNLAVLTAGSTRLDPAIALSSTAMRKLLLDFRQQYDFIVIDSAPVLAYVDVRIISPLADGIVLVARSGITTREALVRAAEIIHEVQGAPILNVVLSGAADDHSSFGYNSRF